MTEFTKTILKNKVSSRRITKAPLMIKKEITPFALDGSEAHA
jgi:hypothetical protein